VEELNALAKAKEGIIIIHFKKDFTTTGEAFIITSSKASERSIDELVDLISSHYKKFIASLSEQEKINVEKDRKIFDSIIVVADPISFAVIPLSHVGLVAYRRGFKNLLKITLAHERREASEKSWEEEIDEALKVMEKIAKKARPREDAAELVRRFRNARRW